MQYILINCANISIISKVKFMQIKRNLYQIYKSFTLIIYFAFSSPIQLIQAIHTKCTETIIPSGDVTRLIQERFLIIHANCFSVFWRTKYYAKIFLPKKILQWRNKSVYFKPITTWARHAFFRMKKSREVFYKFCQEFQDGGQAVTTLIHSI